MRWVTWIDDHKATVEVVSDEGGKVRARIETLRGTYLVVREVEVEVTPGPNGEVSLRWPNGQRGSAWVGPAGPDGLTVDLRQGHVVAKVKKELDAWLTAGEDAAGSGAVTVAMPGRVVKVLARVGDAVLKGQAVLIIEAMKMENEVKARRSGHVRALLVKEGDSVEGGRVLMEIGD